MGCCCTQDTVQVGDCDGEFGAILAAVFGEDVCLDVDKILQCGSSAIDTCIPNARPHTNILVGGHVVMLQGACECLRGYVAVTDAQQKFIGCSLDTLNACDTSALAIASASHNCPKFLEADETCELTCATGFHPRNDGGTTLTCTRTGPTTASVAKWNGLALSDITDNNGQHADHYCQ